jgi:hypothetical protein
MIRRRISRIVTVCIAGLCALAYACQSIEERISEAEQAGSSLNGSSLNGSSLNGSSLNGMTLLGFSVVGATQDDVPLMDLRVEGGELVAERGGVTLRGSGFAGAYLKGVAHDPSTMPPTFELVRYHIAEVEPELSVYDTAPSGSTFLYTIEQEVAPGQFVSACPEDANGERYAIPLAAEWDEYGNRTDSSGLFTLACTKGVIAKCYRWGYRPWLTGYGDMDTMHWACTRLARADYCGNGVHHTEEGKLINVWDTLPPPGPVQSHGGTSETVPLEGMKFEAAFDTAGAVCMSQQRWDQVGSSIIAGCPNTRLVDTMGSPIICDNAVDARALRPSALMFRESLF